VSAAETAPEAVSVNRRDGHQTGGHRDRRRPPGITAVLVGDWLPGDTWHLAPDGRPADADQTVGAGWRLNTLDPSTATEILHALGEAHLHIPARVSRRPELTLGVLN
jgi:hypothetical protein